MGNNPFGDLSDASLVEETPLDTNQPELIFTKERLQEFDNQVIRRFAAAFESDEINGKSPRFVIETALGRQRSLSEFEDK